MPKHDVIFLGMSAVHPGSTASRGRTLSRARKTWMTVFAATAAAVLLLGLGAAPAEAAWWHSIKRGSTCMFLALNTSTPVTLNSCNLVGSALQRVNRGTYNGHQLLQIKIPSTRPYCVDSRAQRSGHVRSHPCNSGSYQLLEVFTGSTAGTVVLKSLGAWQNQRVNICISTSSTKGSKMVWATCNIRSAAQQFRFA